MARREVHGDERRHSLEDVSTSGGTRVLDREDAMRMQGVCLGPARLLLDHQRMQILSGGGHRQCAICRHSQTSLR